MSKCAWLKFINFILLFNNMMACGNFQPVKEKIVYSEPDPDSVLRSLSVPNRTLDPTLTPLLEEFRSILENRGFKEKNQLVSLVLRDLPPGYAGYCITQKTNQKNFKAEEGYVVIDTKLSDLQRRAVIWHELGHCLFNLKHTIGQGIMNEFIPSDSQLIQSWSILEGDYLQLLEKESLRANQEKVTQPDDHIGFKLTPFRY